MSSAAVQTVIKPPAGASSMPRPNKKRALGIFSACMITRYVDDHRTRLLFGFRTDTGRFRDLFRNAFDMHSLNWAAHQTLKHNLKDHVR